MHRKLGKSDIVKIAPDAMLLKLPHLFSPEISELSVIRNGEFQRGHSAQCPIRPPGIAEHPVRGIFRRKDHR